MKDFKGQFDQAGFTLIEVIVSTAIFISVVVAMLGLFDYTLKVNRRVQALREVAQGTRTFAETLTREIRNGSIDYNASSWAPECDESNYTDPDAHTTSLALITRTGDKLCFFFNKDGQFQLKKLTTNGEIEATVFQSSRFRIIPDTFEFFVVPRRDPKQIPYPSLQPYVTVIAQFEINLNQTVPTIVNYQTTISTDVYDIPRS